jgi:hypothetical protein
MMSMVIIADGEGAELRALEYLEYDFEVGDFENSFLVTGNRAEWEPVPDGARVYIPGTEYGGIYKHLETDTKAGTFGIGGYTWRGMLQNKTIQPPSDADYATDSGELNALIKERVEAEFPDLFTGAAESTGVTVSYQYNRYVNLYDGLRSMLKSVGYRLNIEYDQVLKKVVVSAAPIVDYSSKIEYSSDMNADYFMNLNSDGVNHLICLGQGELKNRVVVHLYVDADGNISQHQTFAGADEICAVYDYAGAAREDLIQSGTQQLKNMASHDSFQMELDTAQDVAIGDIVGGRDYVTGKRMTAPIVTKICTWKNGFEDIAYKLSDDVDIIGD